MSNAAPAAEARPAPLFVVSAGPARNRMAHSVRMIPFPSMAWSRDYGKVVFNPAANDPPGTSETPGFNARIRLKWAFCRTI